MVAPLLRRLSAFVVLVALCGSTVLPLFGDLHTVADVACADDAWLTDAHAASHHAQVQFESVREPVAGEHCAACHLQRAMAGADDDAKRAQALVAERPGWAAAPAIGRPDRVPPAGVPTRAPPVTLL